MIWTVTPAHVYQSQIRDGLDVLASDLGLGPVQWTGTPDGAWSTIAAQLAWEVSQGVAMALASITVDTAPPQVLAAMATAAGITPRPATHSRITATVELAGGTGAHVFTAADRARAVAGDQVAWRVVEPLDTPVAHGEQIVLEAVESGPHRARVPVDALMTTPAPDVERLLVTAQVATGRAAESPAELRSRIAASSTLVGGPTGLRASILNLPWVEAADVRVPYAGMLRVTVAPAAVGSDREAELAELLYQGSATSLTEGAVALTTTDANGQPVTVYYTPGGVEGVDFALTAYTDGTVGEQGLRDQISAALAAVIAAIPQGGPVLRLRVLAALSIPGVVAVAPLFINGSTAAAVYPANVANSLALGTVTVSLVPA